MCKEAGLTSAGGFVALRFGNFMGFQQLGVILAGGITLCLIAVLLILPLMVLWREGLQKPIRTEQIDPENAPKGLSYHMSGLLLSVISIAALLCLTQIQHVQIDYDLSNLRKEGMAYNELSDDERALADANFPPVLLEFETKEELARAHQLMSEVVAQKKEPYINGVLSVFSVLPIDQKERITHIQNIVDSLNHKNSKFLPKKVQNNLSSLRNLEPEILTKDHLPVSIRQLIGGTTHRLLLFPQGNMWMQKTIKWRRQLLHTCKMTRLWV